VAGKDFARIEVTASDDKENDRPVRQTTTRILIALLLVVVMAAFSGGFWLGRHQGAEMASSQDKARLQALIKQQESELENLRLVAKQRHQEDHVSMSQVGDLIFYNDLPQQSVTPSALHQSKAGKTSHIATLQVRDMIKQEMQQQPVFEINKQAANISASHKKTNSNQTYQIQLASFQNHTDAIQFSHKMDAKGVVTRIQKMKLAQLGTWYRIYTGNYEGHTQANKALLKLKNNIHVTGLVVQR